MNPAITRCVYACVVFAWVVLVSACGGGSAGGSTSTTIYTATCWDDTTRTSTVSGEVAAAQCPVDPRSTLVTSVPAASYTGDYASEKLAVFNRLNEDRERCGFGKLAQNALLDTAAQNHADYLVANRASEGHSETPGSPLFTGISHNERIAHTGYLASQASEGISGSLGWGTGSGGVLRVSTGGNAIQIPLSANPPLVDGLRGLYAAPYHLMDLMAGYRGIGIGSYYKDDSDQYLTLFTKALVMNYGTPVNQINQMFSLDAVATFPCEGTADLTPYFLAESPNPFAEKGSGDAWGQPVYVRARTGAMLKLTSGTITLRGGEAVPTKRLVYQNNTTMQGDDVRKDPHGIMGANEVFLVPTIALAENATYDVVLQGTNTLLINTTNPTGAWSKLYSFSTSVYVHEATP